MRNKMEQKNINGIKIYHFSEIDSTNKAAMQKEDAAHLDTVVADSQTGGRGRLGRSFFSPDGGLYVTIVLEPCKIVCGLSMCTAAAAVAVSEALEDEGVFGLKIKWVNDILLDGRKVCGILTEAVSENGVTKKVIIGIGINVNNKSFPKEIRDVATSLRMLLSKKSDRTEIINSVLDSIEKYYNVLINEGNLEKIIEEYKKLCVNIGKEVVTTGAPEVVEGVAIDITEKGELVIQKKDGNTVAVNSGEVSVRGIYGYI